MSLLGPTFLAQAMEETRLKHGCLSCGSSDPVKFNRYLHEDALLGAFCQVEGILVSSQGMWNGGSLTPASVFLSSQWDVFTHQETKYIPECILEKFQSFVSESFFLLTKMKAKVGVIIGFVLKDSLQIANCHVSTLQECKQEWLTEEFAFDSAEELLDSLEKSFEFGNEQLYPKKNEKRNESTAHMVRINLISLAPQRGFSFVEKCERDSGCIFFSCFHTRELFTVGFWKSHQDRNARG